MTDYLSLPASGTPAIGTPYTAYKPLAVYRFAADGDNYEPVARREHRGTVAKYVRHDGTEAYVITDTDIPNPTRCVYLLDVAGDIIPTYVAGWRYADGVSAYIRSRSNTDAEVSAVYAFPMSGINARSTGYAWRIGPRRAYHLILTPTDGTAGE